MKDSNKKPHKTSKKLFLFDFISLFLLALVVFAAAYLSYYMEERGYRSIFSKNATIIFGMSLSVLLSLTSNTGKIMLTYMSVNTPKRTKLRFGVTFLRSIMMLISLLMTLMIVTNQFTAPNVKTVVREKVRIIEYKYDDLEQSLEQSNEKKENNRTIVFNFAIQEIKDRYQPIIDEAKAGESFEMNNVINGVWDGRRYKAFKAKRIRYQGLLEDGINTLTQSYNQDMAKLANQYQAAQEKFENAKQSELAKQTTENYLDSFDSQNRFLVDTIALLNKLGIDIKTYHFIMAVALMLMLMIEFLPILLASHVFKKAKQHNQDKAS